MGRNAIVVDARERAILLIRLACIALGSTLVLLAGTGVLSLAAAILLLYLAGAVVMRYSPAVQRAPFLAGAIDLVAVTALTFAFPLTFAPWVLYTFAIGAAALRFGAIGAIAATAFAIVGFDLSLAARAAEARAADLWPVQALIAIGLVTAEIAWVLGRADPTVTSAAAGALAALVHVREPDALLRATVTEIARVPGVRGVWVWQRGPDHRLRTTITSGVGPNAELGVDAETLRRLQSPVTLDRVLSGANGVIVPVNAEPPLSVGVDLADVPEDQRQATTATVNDLLAHVAPLVAAAFERSRLTDDSTALVALGSAIASVTGERTQAGALAALAIEAGRIVQGHAGIVRVADGSTLTGDVDGPAIAEVARDRRLPTIATVKDAGFAILSIGEGRVLAARGEHEVLAGRITHLERLGLAGRERLALPEERDEYQRAAQALGRDVESLGGALRAREDALATAVHELRNPLTAVHGYATLMSRNLKAVQGQLTQLERLMSDLLGTERAAAATTARADVVAEAREAIARARVRSGADIELDAPSRGIRLAIDPPRFAQLLETSWRTRSSTRPS